MTTTVGPGELTVALAAAKSGDTLDVFGIQDLGGRYTNRKTVTLTNGKGQRATLQGALIDAGGLSVDGGTDPFNGFLLDDNTPLDDVGRPSWIINYPNVAWQGIEMTNRSSKIGLQPNSYGAGGSGFSLRFFYMHDVGGMFATAAEAGSQAQKHKDGRYSTNHDQGFYASGSVTGIGLSDGLLERCADRGLQFRGGVSGATVKRVIVRDCGMGFMWGDPCSNVLLEDSILLDNAVVGRYLLEEYQTGSGNAATNVIAFNSDGRKAIGTSSVTLTNVREIDPLYDPAARKIATNSPALGLGPSFIQPAAPAPVGDLSDFAAAYALLKTGTLWHNTLLGAKNHPCKGYADANPGEAAQIDTYVAALVNTGSATPPQLTTATGRGLVAIIDTLLTRP